MVNWLLLRSRGRADRSRIHGKARRCIMQAKPRRWAIELGSLFLASICWASSAQGEALKTAVVSPGRIVRLGNMLSIGTAASGVVADLQVRDGMRVEKGQLLVRIECADL